VTSKLKGGMMRAAGNGRRNKKNGLKRLNNHKIKALLGFLFVYF
jgi:hypothetical protein